MTLKRSWNVFALQKSCLKNYGFSTNGHNYRGVGIKRKEKGWDTAVSKARMAALSTIEKAGGLPLMLRLAEASTSPWTVGVTAASGKLADDSIFPQLLSSPKAKLINFSRGYAATRFASEGWRWVASLPISSWTPEQIASFALVLPFEPKLWDFMAAHGQAAADAYWNQCCCYNRSLTLAEQGRAILKWLELKRVGPAIEVLSLMLDQHNPNPAFVVQITRNAGDHRKPAGNAKGNRPRRFSGGRFGRISTKV